MFGTLVDAFSPLKVRNFRMYLGGQAVSLLGTWMQHTAQSWVVWELTQSPAALGTVAMLGSLPLLVLGPFAGAWADRLDRRKVLIGTQVVAMLLACVLALLVQTGAVQLWHVYMLAVSLGVITALDFPAQQAFVGDLGGMTEIRKVVVVNAMINQASRMLGPSLAGWVMGTLGVAPAFWLNAASFIAVITTLVLVSANQVRKEQTDTRVLTEFWEGLRFIGTQPRIQDLMVFTAFVTFFGIATMQIMPAFASTVLHQGPEALGLLLGASGAGSLTSVLLVVPVVQRMRRTGVVLASVMVWAGTWYLVLSSTDWMALCLLALFATGLSFPVVMTTANSLLQTLAPITMRARLLSAWLMISFGLQPLASSFIGHIAEWFTAPVAIRTNGLLFIGGTLLWFAIRPELRVWEANAPAPSVQPRQQISAAD